MNFTLNCHVEDKDRFKVRFYPTFFTIRSVDMSLMFDYNQVDCLNSLASAVEEVQQKLNKE